MDTINNNFNLFEKAQRDLKHLEWAIKEWNGLIKDGAIYLILDAFTSFYRISKAIDELQKDTSHENIRGDFKNVQNEFVKTCNTENIQTITLKLDETFFTYLNEKLYEVVRASEDNMLFKDDGSYHGEFSYDTANDFIEFFTGIFHLIKFIEVFHPQLQINHLKKRFNTLEKAFKKEFYHFASLEEQLAYQNQRFLPYKNEWWYIEKPSEHKIDYMELYLVPFNVNERIGECPAFEKLAKYAFEDMADNERQSVEDHIYKCDYCFNEVLQLRSDEQEPHVEISEYELNQRIQELEIPVEPPPVRPPVKESDFLDWLTDLMNSISKLKWSVPQFAGEAAQEQETEPIKGFYNIIIKPEEQRKLTFKKPDEATDDLSPLLERIQAGFYYKVYGIYKKDGEIDVKEESSGERQSLPFTIQLAEDTDFSMVLIGLNEDNLRDNSVKIVNMLKTKSNGQKIQDVACVFVEIKSL